MTQTIARYDGRDGVLAYGLAPDVVSTCMSECSAERLAGEPAVTAVLATAEYVPPEELAELMAFRVSGRCRHLTGATLDVNRGSYVG